MYQPFEPELDWSSFSVAVPEAGVPKMHEALGALEAQPGRLAEMRRVLACAAQHMVYSSITGGVLGDDGEGGKDRAAGRGEAQHCFWVQRHSCRACWGIAVYERYRWDARLVSCTTSFLI